MRLFTGIALDPEVQSTLEQLLRELRPLAPLNWSPELTGMPRACWTPFSSVRRSLNAPCKLASCATSESLIVPAGKPANCSL